MLLGLLLVLLILVSIALGAVVLLQRSEGGALGMGGGPSGFMTARGAGDLLTRLTWILASVFFVLCLGLTVLQGRMHRTGSVVDRLKIDPLSADSLNAAPAPAPAQPAAPADNRTGFEAPTPQVGTAPAAAPAASASTPPDTNTGPTNPTASAVGGLPANGTTPAPRAH